MENFPQIEQKIPSSPPENSPASEKPPPPSENSLWNTEETIAKYAIDANLLRLGSTNPKKNIQTLDVFLAGGKTPHQFFFSKIFRYLNKTKILIFFSSKVFKFEFSGGEFSELGNFLCELPNQKIKIVLKKKEVDSW